MTQPTPALSTSSFIAQNYRFLLFGFLLMGIGNFGQTYFIALYRMDMQIYFGLSDIGFSNLYSAMTLLSSLALLYTGQFIDKWSASRVAGLVVVALALSCLAMGFSQSLLTLAIALFMLRHFGQGLTAHTATTAISRAYSGYRGRSLSVVQLGYASCESVFPFMATALLVWAGWQQNWILFAGAVLLLLPIIVYLAKFEPPRDTTANTTPDTSPPEINVVFHATRKDVLRDIRFYLVLPLYLASPFFLTGMFFNNVLLAEERGWSLNLLATAFAFYAIVKIVLLPLSGYLIDRFQAIRVLPFAAFPLAGAFGVLLLPQDMFGTATPIIYLGLCGVHVELMTIAAGGLWVELFGTKHLGSIRSMISMVGIFSTAAAPIVFGYVLAYFDFTILSGAAIIYIAFAAGLAFLLPRLKVAVNR
ncbi:MAG: MFS transporter [Alphaproteobacteria bacterium]|nr:MFS transporter [Alphaproteobacteria bacterium]